MMRDASVVGRGTWLSAPLAIPLVMAGVALPLGFVAYLDALVKFLGPAELLAVYGWAWLVSLVAGLAAAFAVSVLAITFTWIVRPRTTAPLRFISQWAASAIAVAALIKVTKLWLKAVGLPGMDTMFGVSAALALSIAIGCAVWTWRRPDHFRALHSIAKFGTAAGLVVVGVAALIAWSRLAQGSEGLDLSPARPVQRGPNIVLLTVDTLAADHMSLYGYQRPTTPHLERVAQQATVFERFYANSNFTTPSVNAIIHGLRPWSSRVLHLDSEIDPGLAKRNLAARLKVDGYQTFAVATNQFVIPSRLLIARWLDKVALKRAGLALVISAVPEQARILWRVGLFPDIIAALRWSTEHIVGTENRRVYTPEIAFAKARELVAGRERGRPFLLWVHLYEPHAPYAAPPPFVGQFDARPEKRTRRDSIPPEHFEARLDPNFPALYAARYDEAILYVDQNIGEFVDWLAAEGLSSETLLMITADHGESFIKGYGTHGGPMVFNSLIHIPLIIREPLQRTGRRVRGIGEQIDLMPTLLDLAGLPFAGAGEGHSLRSVMTGAEGASAVFSMNFEQNSRFESLTTGTVSMIESRWKFDHYLGHQVYPMMPSLQDALYDVESDPLEATNLIASHPDVAARMLSKIEAELEQHDKPAR
jgi:arylsulfatase A-like enzyme